MRNIFFRCFLLLFVCCNNAQAWGFFGHEHINRLAVFTLPPEMLVFYKFHIGYITQNAVNPDKRRYAVKDEAPRHYLDVDIYDKIYNDSAVYKMPRYWNEAVAKFTEDTLMAYGVVPWHIFRMKNQLTNAFKQRNAASILRISADLGHYIADANVPLHTTENYNGQLTNQIGIHGFWESRLPELFLENYELWVGQATYLPSPQLTAWEAVTNAHQALDSVFRFERELSASFPEDKKYAFEQRNRANIRTYSKDFSKAYHERLAGQVERRMKASIKMVGDFWFTCWLDAGSPNLRDLLDKKYEEDPMLNPELDVPNKSKPRSHEGDTGQRIYSPREMRNMYATKKEW